MNIRGYAMVFLAASFWGLLGPLAKFAFADGAAPLEVAFWRAAFGGLFFIIHCGVFRLYALRKKDRLPILLFGLVGVSVFFGAYQLAVQKSGAAVASILLYTAPFWVALLSRVFLGESMQPVKVLALFIAMAGAFLVCVGSGGQAAGGGTWLSLGSMNGWGVFFGLLSGFTYALHYIFGKRYLSEYKAATLYCYTLPVGALGLLPWVHFQARPLSSWLVFLGLGLICTYGAYMFYCAGLKALSATRVAITANLEPVIAALLAYVWWGEYFLPIGYLGGALVLSAVFLMVLESSQPWRRRSR